MSVLCLTTYIIILNLCIVTTNDVRHMSNSIFRSILRPCYNMNCNFIRCDIQDDTPLEEDSIGLEQCTSFVDQIPPKLEAMFYILAEAHFNAKLRNLLLDRYTSRSSGDTRMKGNAKFTTAQPCIGWLLYCPDIVDMYIATVKYDR